MASAQSMGCGKSKAADEKKDAVADGGQAAGKDASEGPRTIVVFGATGAQGGSVIRAMKGDEKFVVKAATRNLESDKAKALAESGVRLVQADLDDRESVKKALEGAYGVFLVTNFWELLDKDKEIAQGKTVVDVAKESGIQHLVFSGLDDCKGLIGKECAHFDTKFAVTQYIIEQGVPYTIVRYACYYENLLNFFKMRQNEDHEYVLDIPMGDAPLDMVCVAESGEVIHQVFLKPDEFKGKQFTISSERLKVDEYAAILTKAFDTKKFVAGTLTPEAYGKLGFPGSAELAVMFEFFASDKYHTDLELTRQLHPDIPNFEQWVDNNKEAIEASLK